MQIGCKQEATTGGRGSVPETLSQAWSHLPDHIKMAVLALVEPYRHCGAGAG